MKATEIKKYLLHSLKLRGEYILSQWNNPIGTDTRHFFVDNLFPEGFVDEVFKALPMDGMGFIQQYSFRGKNGS